MGNKRSCFPLPSGQAASYRNRGGVLLITFFLLLTGSQWLHAAGSERFLERLSSETQGDRLVVTVHFMQTLQYLSHTPEEGGDRLTIRFRRSGTVLGNVINEALGEGVKRLVPAPGQIPQMRLVTASGNLDMDPGVVIEFNQAQAFEVRPGPNARSIRIALALADDSGQIAVPQGDTDEALAETPEFSGEAPQDRRLRNLFVEARNSIQAGNYQRATAIYDKIIASGVEPYRKEAILALGIVRETRKQLAQARAQFELYLQAYPEDPRAGSVQLRLDEVAVQQEARETGKGPAESIDGGGNWNYFGSFDQFYLYDGGKIGDRSSETYRSSLLTSANLSWQGKTSKLDVGGRFSGSYDYSFLDERDSPSRVSYLYLDLAGREGRHKTRLGRQRLSGSGVLGYFDGLHYQYKLSDQHSVRYVSGAPVRSSREWFDSDHWFNGLAVDYHALDDSWFLSLYGLDQTVEGDTDRQALGTEMRYLGETYSLYSLLDYDFYFDELNIFHLFGNWRFSPGTVASMTLEYRRSPILALSNALQGEGTDSIGDLQLDYSDSELEQLALDRSLVYKSAYLSLTHQLTDSWQLQADGGVYQLTSDISEAGPLEEDFDSNDWYLSSQLMGSSLFRPGDLYTAGLRYADSDSLRLTSLLLRTRFPVRDRWRLTPRLRFDFRDRNDDADQWRVTPRLFATYRLYKKTSLEFDLGMEFSRTDELLNQDELDEQFYYLSLGYRHDF